MGVSELRREKLYLPWNCWPLTVSNTEAEYCQGMTIIVVWLQSRLSPGTLAKNAVSTDYQLCDSLPRYKQVISSIYIYIYTHIFWLRGNSRRTDLYARMNKHMQTYMPTYMPPYIHTYIPTCVHTRSYKPYKSYNPSLKPYPTIKTYPTNPTQPYPTALQTLPYPTHTNNTHMCNENKKRIWLH